MVGAPLPAPPCPLQPPRGTPLMTAAMPLPGDYHRQAGVLLLAAAGHHLTPDGILLLHEAPTAWDTKTSSMQCVYAVVAGASHRFF